MEQPELQQEITKIMKEIHSFYELKTESLQCADDDLESLEMLLEQAEITIDAMYTFIHRSGLLTGE